MANRASSPRKDLMKNRVTELRRARGWTKVALADQLNISRQSVHAIEAGIYNPSLPLALAIGRLFGEAVEDIFKEEEESKAPEYALMDCAQVQEASG